MKKNSFFYGLLVLVVFGTFSCNTRMGGVGMDDGVSIQLEPETCILESTPDLQISIELPGENFLQEKHTQVFLREADRGNHVQDFSFINLYISGVSLVDYSHLYYPGPTPNLPVLTDGFEIFASDPNGVGEPLLVWSAESFSLTNIHGDDFLDYALLYPDFKLTLVTHFKYEFEGLKCMEVNVNLAMSYGYNRVYEY